MEKKKFYMTTAIAYTSGKPHIYCKRYEEKSRPEALFTENSRRLRGMKAKRLKMVSERRG